ncbi:DUF3575 domain-containing protein [Coprobacter sp.]
MKRIILLLTLAALGVSQGLRAQKAAVKTNLFSDAFMNVNLGIEVGLTPKWTLDLTGELNGWTLSHNRRWRHWVVQPEARYWFCDRFSGHFVGAHLHGGQYNIGGFNGRINFLGTDARKLRNARFQGWFVGAGVAYGYAWILNRHWNLEAEIGFGYSYTRYDRFKCTGCGKKVEADKLHHYIGPTKAAVNLVYLF